MEQNVEVPAGCDNPPDFDELPETRSLQAEYKKLEARLKVADKQFDGMETTKDALERQGHKVNKLKALQRKVAILIKELSDCRDDGMVMFKVLRRSMSIRMTSSFHRNMNVRGFNGRVVVNHVKKTIEIQVETLRENREEADDVDPSVSIRRPKMQDLKALSGGERSYTTACFIMALWEAMEAPFRCMDEFDVFMDGVNRLIVMELLVQLATEQYPQFQFLFFTPLGLADLGKHPRVQIYQMPNVR